MTTGATYITHILNQLYTRILFWQVRRMQAEFDALRLAVFGAEGER